MGRGGDVHDVVVVTGICVLGRWMDDLIRDLCAAGQVEFAAGEGDDLLPDLGRGGGVPRVLMTPVLGRRLIDLVEAGRVWVIAVVDDPVDSVRFTKADRAVDLLGGVREQTRVSSTNYLLLDNPMARVVTRSYAGVMHDVVAAVIERVGARLDSAVLQRLLEAFGGPLDDPWSLERALEARVPHYLPLHHLGDAMPAEEAVVVRQAVSPLALAAVSHDIGTITWSARTLLFGDRPNEVAPPVADVTGAARILFYGPYFHLPPGTWKCRMVVAFSAEVIGTPFRLMVYCREDVLAKVVLRPQEGGAFEGYFTMRHTFPERHIEIHFMNDEGTIEGQVALGQITFTRLAG